MITFFRRWLTSWPALVLLGLVLIAFAVTGVGDPFSSRGAPQGSVAKVGSKTITEPDLLKAFDLAIRNARAQNPSVSQVQLAKQGAVTVIADQLISRTALEQLGRQIRITASDRAIGAEIAVIPAFQVGGKFDEPTFRRVIAENRLSDRELRDSIAGDLIRKQLLTPVTASLTAPASMASIYGRLLVDVHGGSVALVPLGATTPPSDAEISAYYSAHKAAFTLPERRSFRYAFIDRAAIAAGVTIKHDAIAAAFAKDPAKYGAAATRRLQQVVVPDEGKARAIAAAAAKDGFAAAAQRLAGFGAADIAIGDKAQDQFAKETSAEVAAAAFAAPAGGITAPIKTAFGWHIVRVDAIGAKAKTLAEARPAILADLKAKAAETAVSDLVAKIEDGVESGKSFADLAKANGLAIQTQTPVTKDGAAADAPTLAADLLPLAAKAFRHEPGDGAAVEDLGQGRLVVIETMQVLPSAPQPLAAVRTLVADGAARDKAATAARGKADAIVAAVKKGSDFAAAVAAQGLAAPKPISGRRFDVSRQPQVPPIVQAFLATPAKTIKVLRANEGWVLIHVDTVTPGDLASVPGLVDISRRAMAADLPEEMSTAFAAAAKRAVGSQRNEAAIAAVTRRLSGQDSGAQ